MTKQAIWLSYDLGIKGDYPGLYRFLDKNNAKECGNSIAYLNFEYNTNLEFELTNIIKESVELKNGDRIYAIFKAVNENGEISARGKFIIGNRKGSPWEGYFPTDENSIDF